jgi:hypothetical protein
MYNWNHNTTPPLLSPNVLDFWGYFGLSAEGEEFLLPFPIEGPSVYVFETSIDATMVSLAEIDISFYGVDGLLLLLVAVRESPNENVIEAYSRDEGGLEMKVDTIHCSVYALYLRNASIIAASSSCR